MIDLSPDHLKTVERILAEHIPDCEVRAFGSRVTWTAKDYSDLDLAVVGDRRLDLDTLRLLREAFEESDLPFRVDVIDRHAVSESFRKVIDDKYEVIQRGKMKKGSGCGGEQEWEMATLGSIATKDGYGLVDGPFGSNLPASLYTKSGIPVIRGSNLTLGTSRFLADAFVFVSYETSKRHQRSICRPLDIIFTKKGTLGQTGLIPEGGDHQVYLLSSNQMKLTVDRRVADPLFVYYFVSSPASTTKIIRDSESTGVPKTNITYLRNFPISLPLLSEQHAIAHILGTLDDKIDLNRRMNETLEAMAKALFKSWFVDFDPVRAKMEGRDTGLPECFASLFPASFEESTLGEIPSGWKVVALGELMDLAYGKALKADIRRDGSVPVYGSNGQVGWHDEALAAGPGIVVGRKGNPGTVTWAHTDFFVIDTAFFVVQKALCHSLHFLYHVLKAHDLASLGADSAVPGLNRNLVYMNAQVLPSRMLLERFEAYTSSLMERVHISEAESRTLAAIRDALLPKLVSGEIRVQDAERFVEGVV